ncbi:MAG: hypothetical protein ACKVT2_15160 [Saprospiraceae bacterium]
MANNVSEDIYFRGIFMSLFIDIEFVLGNVLSYMLAKDDDAIMNILEFITPSLLLDKKITTTFSFLKKKHPAIHAKFKDDLNDLRDLAYLRNDFAHKRIEIDLANETLYFLKIENGKSQKGSNTFAELNAKFERLKELLKVITEIENEIEAKS